MMNGTDLSVSAQCLLVTDMIDELLGGILILFRFRRSLIQLSFDSAPQLGC